MRDTSVIAGVKRVLADPTAFGSLVRVINTARTQLGAEPLSPEFVKLDLQLKIYALRPHRPRAHDLN